MAATLSATLWAYACGDGTTEPPSPPPDPPQPTTVTVSPATAQLAALGATVQLSAEVRDQNGQAMAGATVTWASDATATATVSSTGLVTAVGNGTASIAATAGSSSGTATVTVAQEVSAVAVSPAADTLVAGDTLRLAAEATDANGHAVAEVEFSWASSDTLVAVVDDAGFVTGVGAGEAEVTATVAEITGRAELTVVAPAPTTVAVTPDTVALMALGQTAQLAAEVRDQVGRVMEGVPASWSSADTTVAAVDSAGLVTAAGVGETTITATSGEASGERVVTVMQSAGSVIVSPSADTVVLGDSLQLVAEAFDENGHRVEGAQFDWSSSAVSVARVDGSGLVTAVAEGTATITATAGDARGTAEITVQNPDRAALVALYHATNGPNWINNENWLTDAPLGDWYGVDTDGSGRVVHVLWLVGNDLSGPIPPELGSLANLTRLTLEENALSGPIPPELGSLANLTTLGLWGNQLSGPIPPELGSLANLTRLTLEQNALSGPIPPELGNLTDLNELWLARNDLSGPIPPELGSLANLTTLGLGSNRLSGPIPPELGSLANLTWLGLGSNRLSGPIPPELGSLANLTTLGLWGNQLSGPIPPELGNIANLRELWLRYNDLSGPIPPELGNLTSLTQLWLRYNDLSGPIPPELGSLANLTWLGLGSNRLSGPIPPELGSLANLTGLDLSNNQLSGPIIPQSFLRLDRLRDFRIGGNESLCVPGSPSFVAWLRGIENRDDSESLCNAADLAALKQLYEAASGAAWIESAGWSSDGAVEEWHGVTADSLGWVTALDLTRNGLAGRLPESLTHLAHMTELRIGGNPDLSGRLPLSLADLSLQTLHYAGTGLCAPEDALFQAWLDDIASHEGTGAECPPLSDREILEVFHEAAGGQGWVNSDNWRTDRPLGTWHGVEADGEGRVISLQLWHNGISGSIPRELGGLGGLEALALHDGRLTGAIPAALGNLANLKKLELSQTDLEGPIPPELGGLGNLTELRLYGNDLEGSIPPELGDLANLEALYLSDNDLTGPIPPELGDLANLEQLGLGDNDLTGPIPPELGSLASLEYFNGIHNDLSGPIPPELGSLANLTTLFLDYNELSGPVPPEFRGLSNLRELGLTHNPGLEGPLPAALTDLTRLSALLAGGTQLCAPSDPAFQAWLEGVHKRRITPCHAANPSMAYLTQAVQSREFPVPLVAGEKALLRVFPVARKATSEGIPLVRARFYLDGRETHVVDIPGKSAPIPTELDESSLLKSANAVIPAEVVEPGLEMVIDVDPEETLDTALAVSKRIPETGRLPVDVRAVPLFDLTLIPFIWSETQDSSIVELIDEMAADPENHNLLSDTRDLLPVRDLTVTAHDPVLTSSNNGYVLISEVAAIRAMEGGTGHYMAMMSTDDISREGPAGIARRSGRYSFLAPYRPSLVAHELGHNLSLRHAPCGAAGGPDPSYPYPDGSSGTWGYDFRAESLVSPSTPDLMSYCGPRRISDYHFTNALRYRLVDEGAPEAAVVAGSSRSLFLWGGIGTDSVPFLDPAFVVDAPAALPDSAGEYRLTGQSDSRVELFSLAFAMPETADGDGSSSFAFVLPVQAGWEGNLSSITLTGPGGSFTLDGESDQPVAILRNPRTGQVRGILRDLPPPAQAAMETAGSRAEPGLEVLFSRGIPDAAAWNR